MSKRWTLKDDQFLVAYAGNSDQGGKWPDYVASHDLGHHGKNAGKKRLEKLAASGVREKIDAYQRAEIEMNEAWGLAFGPNSWKEIILEEREKAGGRNNGL